MQETPPGPASKNHVYCFAAGAEHLERTLQDLELRLRPAVRCSLHEFAHRAVKRRDCVSLAPEQQYGAAHAIKNGLRPWARWA